MSATIWTNGSIITMDDRQPAVDALLAFDHRVVAVGSLDDVQASGAGENR